jgi:hypothetical protein
MRQPKVSRREQAIRDLMRLLLQGRQPGNAVLDIVEKHGLTRGTAKNLLDQARMHLRMMRSIGEDLRETARDTALAVIDRALTDPSGANYDAIRDFLKIYIDLYGLNQAVDVPIDELRQVLKVRGLIITQETSSGSNRQLAESPASGPDSQFRGGQTGLPPELDPDFTKS